MNMAATKKTPIAMISARRRLVEDIPVVLEGAPEARRGQAEDHEDHGEARHEQQTRGEHAAPIGLAQVLRGHSGDR